MHLPTSNPLTERAKQMDQSALCERNEHPNDALVALRNNGAPRNAASPDRALRAPCMMCSHARARARAPARRLTR